MTVIDDIASRDYRAVLRKRYTSPGWGASGYSWVETVRLFADEIGANSILDYGCGRGTLKKTIDARLCNRVPQYDVREYDPGIVGKDALPEPADLVVSTDVLEHIEPELLPNVLAHMKGLARKGLFLNIAIGPAKEILPDGRNAHLIQQKMSWWMSRLIKAGFTQAKYKPGKGFSVWIKV